jgi:hypothetical protein
MRHVLSALLLVVACSSPRVTTGPSAAKPLSHLSWLAGSWRTTSEGVDIQETWSSPRSGVMLGVNRSRSPDGGDSTELMRIEARGEQLVYIAAPHEQAVTTFVATEVSSHGLVVENAEHDFPKRIAYARSSDEGLQAAISGSTDQPVIRWTFAREAGPNALAIEEALGRIQFDPPTQSIEVEIPGNDCARLVCAVLPGRRGPTLQLVVLDTTLDCSEPARGRCSKPDDVSAVAVGGRRVPLQQMVARPRPWWGPIPFAYRSD